jgi:hypothetical protein
MQNDNEKLTKDQCKNTLKLLDFLRKSQCTQTKFFLPDAPMPYKNYECVKTLLKMENVAKECVESYGSTKYRK